MNDLHFVKKLINLCLVNGYLISVHDGEEWVVKKSNDVNEIKSALASTEADTILIRHNSGEIIGSFWCVYGNCPDEVFNTWSDNDKCESLLKTIGYL